MDGGLQAAAVRTPARFRTRPRERRGLDTTLFCVLHVNKDLLMKTESVNVSVPDGFEDAVATTERELEDQVRLMSAPTG